VNASDAQLGIRAALRAMIGQPGGKVVTMSWQSLNWWWQVSNEIDYWQSQFPNHLIFFAAAGTSGDDWVECGLGFGGGTLIGAGVAIFNPYIGLAIFLAGSVGGCVVPNNSNVVFPAQHQHVVAVTCIDFGTGDVSNNCHHGSKVEFAAFQAFPSVHGASDAVDRLGGSSGASPVVAGQAALIWSRYPHFNRAQVLDRMRWSSQYYLNRSSKQGYGIVNTHKAVGGMHNAWIDGVQTSGGGFNQVAYHTLQGGPSGGDGPFSYNWSNGQTTQTIHTSIGPGEPDHTYTLTVTDHSDGTSVTTTYILSPPPGGCSDPTQVVCD
ncbi:MAG TPA: S8/S53 family peptidase, partial [Myxococcaceae bacterium]|nr:S8/S53 family peptidase [Myxococcaceae bacterium]